MSSFDAHAKVANASAEADALHDAPRAAFTQAQIDAANRAIALRHVDLGTLAGFEPEETEALYARALEDVRHGLITAATSRFLKLIALYPRNPKFIRGLALCYHHQRLWGWAETAYRLALQRDPDDGIAMALLGEVVLYTDGKAAAHRMLTQVVARGAKSAHEAPYVQRAQAIVDKIRL